jgi:peptidoglycan/xylan/chitin deacetylase (PgdA/CDA1 family)
MAGKRASSGKGKAASSKGRTSPARRKGGGGLLGRLILYPLAAAGGLYAGIQVYTAYQAPPRHAAGGKRPAVPPRGELRRVRAHENGRGSGDRVRVASARDEPERVPASTPPEQSELPPSTGKIGDGHDHGPEVSELRGAGISASPGTPGADPPGGGALPALRPLPPAGRGAGRTFSPLPPLEVARGAGTRREVALTFDAGADYRPAQKILEALAAGGIRSTFFLTGEWVRKNPRTARRIAAEGHEIGNHSWDHPAFTGLTPEEMREQLARTDEVIEEVTGRTTRPYFRPPLGARDSRVLKLLGDEGFLSVYWTLDSRDSVDRGITPEQVRTRVLEQSAPGSIVLMHCGSQPSADALPEILRGLRVRGLTPVTISRLLAE